jgi:glycine oxidase
MAVCTASSRPKIAVLGAGIAGLGCGYELQRRGAQVTIFEALSRPGLGATHRSAGMLGFAAEFEDHLRDHTAEFARSAQAIWPQWAKELGDIGLVESGTLLVDESGRRLPALAAALQGAGVPADLRRDGRTLSLPGEHQVDPVAVAEALSANFAALGGGWRLGVAPAALIAAGDRFEILGERYDQVLIATGAARAPIVRGARGAPLNTGLPELIPVKGQMLALEPGGDAPDCVIRDSTTYVVPKRRWTLVGATSEPNKADLDVEETAIETLLRAALRLAPGLSRLGRIAAWAGVRPASPDGAPLIGETAAPGVYAVLGLGRHGVLFAPAAASAIADVMLEGRLDPLIARFSPRRFDNGVTAPLSA